MSQCIFLPQATSLSTLPEALLIGRISPHCFLSRPPWVGLSYICSQFSPCTHSSNPFIHERSSTCWLVIETSIMCEQKEGCWCNSDSWQWECGPPCLCSLLMPSFLLMHNHICTTLILQWIAAALPYYLVCFTESILWWAAQIPYNLTFTRDN